MNMHHNARLTPNGRELLIERLERGDTWPTSPAPWASVSARSTNGGGDIARKIWLVYRIVHRGP